jgi:hypothetical protein
LFRSLLIIVSVAGIAAIISHLESAQAERQPQVQQTAWVRTVDGWEPSAVLTAQSVSAPPSLHPFLVAGFELGASLFALVAFPSKRPAA